MRRNMLLAAAALLSAGMILAGCGRGEEMTDRSSAASESNEIPTEDGQGFMQSTAKEELEDTDTQSASKEEPENADVQSAAKEDPEEDTWEPKWYPIDFSVIEENHEILEYDILISRKFYTQAVIDTRLSY